MTRRLFPGFLLLVKRMVALGSTQARRDFSELFSFLPLSCAPGQGAIFGRSMSSPWNALAGAAIVVGMILTTEMQLVRALPLPLTPDPDWVGLGTAPDVGLMSLGSGLGGRFSGVAYAFDVLDSGNALLGALGSVDVTLLELFGDGAGRGDLLSLDVGQIRYETGLGHCISVLRVSAVSGLPVTGASLQVWARGLA